MVESVNDNGTTTLAVSLLVSEAFTVTVKVCACPSEAETNATPPTALTVTAESLEVKRKVGVPIKLNGVAVSVMIEPVTIDVVEAVTEILGVATTLTVAEQVALFPLESVTIAEAFFVPNAEYLTVA